jgi:hypothetical protein
MQGVKVDIFKVRPEYRVVEAYKCPGCGLAVSYAQARLSYQWQGDRPMCPRCNVPMKIEETGSSGGQPRSPRVHKHLNFRR